VLAILSPGQGAQQQGFLAPWLTIDSVQTNLRHHSEATGVDLTAAGTTMSDTDIVDTAIAQPLIVAASLLSADLLGDLPAQTVLAGHSVGEFAAAAIAGALSTDDALALVAARGAAMAAASISPAGGMTAILGGDLGEVTTAITVAGCSVANVNATGQIVAAGTLDALEALAANPPARARLRPLAVAGAFHTALMGPARDRVAEVAGGISPVHPHLGLLSNADGTLVANGAEALSRLVSQVCAPVRWDLCMRTLASLGVTGAIELAPAGTLTALIRRELPHVETVSLRSPDDLPAAHQLIRDHAAELTDQAMPWQILVAPAGGTATVDRAAERHHLAAGDVVVRVTTRTEAIDVRTPHSGQLVEWLVHDGDPVSAGQPLARLTDEVLA
jgi:[acyl-carrier-protein] S-malonyltransferase